MERIKRNRMEQLHNILAICSWIIFAVSLVRMLLVYGSLPEKIGVHFGPDGKFDMISDKIFAFYPYIVSIVILLFCELSCFLLKKLKIGIRISEKGERDLRNAIRAFIDVFRFCVLFYFSIMWANSVINQQAMSNIAGTIMAWLYLGILVIFFAVVALIIFVNKLNKRMQEGRDITDKNCVEVEKNI